MNKSRPVLVVFSILAGLQLLTAAGGLSEIVGAKWFFMFGILVAAVQQGMTFYVQQGVVPEEDVASYADRDGNLRAGRASGTSLGANVAVVPTDPHVSDEQIRSAQLVAKAAVGRRKKV